MTRGRPFIENNCFRGLGAVTGLTPAYMPQDSGSALAETRKATIASSSTPVSRAVYLHQPLMLRVIPYPEFSAALAADEAKRSDLV